MKTKLKLLDTFCGAGGCSEGYARAGFEVIGIDNEDQPKYPFQFIKADALEVLSDRRFLSKFDVVHASPVCKRYSSITATAKTHNNHPDQIEEVRKLLIASGKPYVIENVPGSPLKDYVELCGTMFGLNVIRHRLFECNPVIWFPPATCNHHKRVVKHGRKPCNETNFAAVTGHFSDVAFAQKSMGIDWMGQKELAQAIPPAYTEWIGLQMKQALGLASCYASDCDCENLASYDSHNSHICLDCGREYFD